MTTKILDTVLLLALPASGKSEVRRYLDHLTAAQRTSDFHMGPTVQLDDFPYVHLMRRVDDELERLGRPRQFFLGLDRSFRDPRDWGTLIELLNEDHANLTAQRPLPSASAGAHLLDRLDRAGEKVGAGARTASLDPEVRSALARALQTEAADLAASQVAAYPDTLEGRTLVIEFARGGPDKSSMPLPPPFGYGYSLGRLSDAILERAAILYVWVTPEESRRKNKARANPNDPGSILHHGVPLEVMLGEYGCDDMDWLEATSPRKGTVEITTRGRTFHIPIARFDNRVDKTSFIREDPSGWSKERIALVHEGLKSALSQLAGA